MIMVERATRIKATKAEVWNLFQTREGQMQLAGGLVRDIELIGSGVGSKRIMRLDGTWGNGRIEERIIMSDFDRGIMEYEITDTGGVVPFADYFGRMRVAADGPAASLFAISVRFIAVDMPDEGARAMSEQNIAKLIVNLHAAFA